MQTPSPTIETISAASTVETSIPSITAGNSVIADIQDVENGLANLPRDLSNFILAIEGKLQAIESMLAGLLAGSSETAAPPPSTTSSSTFSSPVTNLPASSLCLQPGGVYLPCTTNPLMPTSTTRSDHTTSTQAPYMFTNQTAMLSGTGTAPSMYLTGSPSNQNASASAVTITVAYASPPIPTPSPDNTSTSTVVTYSLSPSPSLYNFNPGAQDNVAVYYGQTPATQEGGLIALCESPNVDIAILSFVFDFFGPQGYPSINFGPGCTTPTATQAAQAPGLMNCTALAPEIAACQQIGKKVLISLGGYIANTSFASDDQATEFAETLWHLFGAGTAYSDSDLRPFGPDVVIDGFDIDNENHNTTSYATFATALRAQFSQDTTKTYYLSAAPQCPLPDASIPHGAMTVADFVRVQFYNNPTCNLDNSSGFQSSFAAWSANLSASSTTPGRPRVYIGAAAFDGVGSGYVVGEGLSSQVSLARELYVDNFGGMMLWDGSEGMANVDEYGDDYLGYAKAALQY